MGQNYDTTLFIEIIESIQGVLFLRQIELDGQFTRFYQGLTGKLVIIDMSEEFITPRIGSALLDKLGLSHLIPSLFPPIKFIVEEPK